MNFTPLFILSITSILSITGKCSDSSSSEEKTSVSFASTSSDGSSFESLGDDKSSVDSMVGMTKSYQRKLAQKMAAKEAKEGKPKKGKKEKKSKKVASSSDVVQEEEEEPQLQMEQTLDFKNYILEWKEESGDVELLSLVSEESSDCDGSCLDDYSCHSDVEDDIQRRKELLRADRLLKSSIRESSSAEEGEDKDASVKTSSSDSDTVSSSSSSNDMKKYRKRRVVRKSFGSSTSASLWSSESGNLTTSFEDAAPKARRAYTMEKSKALLKPWISI